MTCRPSTQTQIHFRPWVTVMACMLHTRWRQLGGHWHAKLVSRHNCQPRRIPQVPKPFLSAVPGSCHVILGYSTHKIWAFSTRRLYLYNSPLQQGGCKLCTASHALTTKPSHAATLWQAASCKTTTSQECTSKRRRGGHNTFTYSTGPKNAFALECEQKHLSCINLESLMCTHTLCTHTSNA